MITVRFYCTESLDTHLGDDDTLSSVKHRRHGKNVEMDIDENDVEKQDSIINLLDRFGCARDVDFDFDNAFDDDVIREVMERFGYEHKTKS